MGVFLVNKTQNPIGLPYPFRGFLPAGGKVPVNLTAAESLTALALVPGQAQRYIGIEEGASAPFNDLVAGDAQSGLLIGALANPLPLQTVVFVEAEGDLPTAVANVITLSADTAYIINGAVDLGGNRIEKATGSQILGFTGAVRDSLTSSNTGALITNPAGVSTPVSVQGVKLVSTAGTIFDIDGSPTTLGIKGCTLVGEFGVISGGIIGITECAFESFSAGVTFLAGGISFSFTDNVVIQTASATGTIIQLAAFVWSLGIAISDNVMDISVDGFMLDGEPDNGNIPAGFGEVTGNILGGATGAGAGLVDIAVNDTRWTFSNNLGAASNSSTLGRYGFTGNVTATVAPTSFTKVAGTTTSSLANRFTHVPSNQMDYVGIEAIILRADVSISATKTGGTGVGYSFAVFKNGGQLGPDFPMIVDNKGSTMSFQVVDETTVPTDAFDVRVINDDNSDSLTVVDFEVLLTKIGG